MAVIHSPNTHLPTDVSHALMALQTLPDAWQVFVGWPDIERERPHFLVVSPTKALVFVSATGASSDILDAFDFEIPSPESADMTTRRLYRSIASLQPENTGNISCRHVLILTNASVSDVETTFQFNIPLNVELWDENDVTLTAFEQLCAESVGTTELIEEARGFLSPASTIRPALTACRPETNGDKLRFFDFDQEAWLRKQLRLPDVSETFSGIRGAHLLKGPAGCGKTLLLLARAVMEHKVKTGVRPLILTHNKPLLQDIRTKLAMLREQHGEHGCRADQVLSWCSSWVRRQNQALWKNAVTYSEWDDYVKCALGERATTETIKFHREEFAYISDHIIETRDQYLSIERTGRQRGLDKPQRELLWDTFEHYHQLLDERGKTDFPRLGLSLYQAARDRRIQVPKCDIVLIDEGQFLPPTLIGILKLAVGAEGTLIIAADPTQGFLQRKSPWTRAGLVFTGRTTNLTRPYRSTKAILQFARAFHESRGKPEKADEVDLPADSILEASDKGEWPAICVVERRQDEIRKACDLVRSLVDQGVQPSNILVIPSSNYTTNDIIDGIRSRVMAKQSCDAALARDAVRINQVRVCTLDSVTGLEAAYVIILGVRDLLEAETDANMQKEHSQLRHDNTARLYMGFTRAGYRLAVVWSGESEPPFPRN